jgi:predicted nucleic acid-binding protein
VVKIVVDSYAWIELFRGSEKGMKVKGLIKDADEVYTPDIVLAEIARKYRRDGIAEGVVKERLSVIGEVSMIIPIDMEIAIASSMAYYELKGKASKLKLGDPSLFDAIVLAITRTLGAKVITGDLHFKEEGETIWLS